MIAVSPYAKKGYISHRRHEFGSILKFVQETFGLGSLGSTEEAVYFLKQPESTADPDTGF